MTRERDFERVLEAWFLEGASEMPDRVYDAVLIRIERVPQRRIARFKLRFQSMNRTTRAALVAAAVVIVAVVGFAVLARPSVSNVAAPPTATASPSPSPSASTQVSALAPEGLRNVWKGDSHAVTGLTPAPQRLWRIEITANRFSFAPVSGVEALASDVSVPTPGQIAFTSLDASAGCALGDVGTYAWSLSSPIGSTATFTKVADPCVARAGLLTGPWVRSSCKDTISGCPGELDPGTYRTFVFDHTFSYTVPTGWAGSADWEWFYAIQTAADYAKEGSDNRAGLTRPAIFTYADPEPGVDDASCTTSPKPGSANPSVTELVAWVRSRPHVVSSKPVPITIDGHAGQMLDVSADTTFQAKCTDGTYTFVGLVTASAPNAWDSNTWGYQWAVINSEKMRLIFLDMGAGRNAMIAIDSPDGTGFDAFVAQSMPIVQSFTFDK